jgi:diguanylate cyclase (GGDEF)-like protein
MEKVLDQCIRIDTLALQTYQALAAACTDPELTPILETLAQDEEQRLAWWQEMRASWESGLLPDIINDSDRLALEMGHRLQEMEGVVPRDAAALSTEEILTTAAKLEFFMLDPVFAELIDLLEPASAADRNEWSLKHLRALVNAIEARSEKGTLPAFLARVLTRAWDDNRALAAYATRDSLTGLLNRRALHSYLQQWTAWAARYGRPLGLVLLDIDGFKRVNDELGYGVGDQLLVAITAIVRETVRSSDLVARYGSDEFAIVAPEADVGELRTLSTRIVEAVRELRVDVDDTRDVGVTVSVGSAVALGGPGAPPRSIDKLLSTADHALFAAKEQGRDRASEPVLVAGEGEPVA